jgi:hypothetical protein
MSSSIPSFDKLNSTNYNTWSGDMEAWYRAQALWRIVSGASKSPTLSTPLKDGEEDKLEAWQVKADKAAGIMWLMVEPAQRVHFREIKDDAVKIWGGYWNLFTCRSNLELGSMPMTTCSQSGNAMRKISNPLSTVWTTLYTAFAICDPQASPWTNWMMNSLP